MIRCNASMMDQDPACQKSRIGFLPWVAAGLTTAAAVALHIVNWWSAGGLWRDEAAAVHLAAMPSLGEIWTHLEHESFPLLSTILLRGWSALGGGETDLALRAFGLGVGLAILAALWRNAWRLSSSPPLLSLLLLGLSPVAIRWGDSLRAYGLGVFFILLTLGLVWEVVRRPSRRTVALAMLAGVFAVQAVYQNSFLLAAICGSGALVPLRRREGRHALLVLSLGLPAALSLLPYLGVIRRANEWNEVTQMAIGLPRMWTVLHRALNDPGLWMFCFWLGLLAAAAVAGVVVITRRGEAKETERTWFLLSVMVTTTAAYYIFLKLAQFPTEVWYYLLWMAIMAVAIDGLVAGIARGRRARIGLSLGVLVAAVVIVPGAWRQARVRMTNVDLIAAHLNETVAPGDLVLVHPWFCGASFRRYYDGPASWTTLPPLEDYGLQRLDLFKQQMQLDDPIAPVRERMETVLRNGGTVWLVGPFPFSVPPRLPTPLPRAGTGPEGWREAPYMMAYGMQAAYFLQRHGTGGSAVEVPLAQAVNPFENLPVRRITGWRSSP